MLKGEKRHFRELAEYVKKEFDNRFPGTWHVIVGMRIILLDHSISFFKLECLSLKFFRKKFRIICLI